MRKLPIFFAFIIFVFIHFAFINELSHTDTPMLAERKLSRGETVKYIARYGFLNAGESVVHIDKNTHYINGYACHKIDVTGKTIGVGSVVKVDDLWRSYVDMRTYQPVKFYRNINEAKYHREESVIFDKKTNQAKVRFKVNDKPEKEEIHKIPSQVEDLISGYFFLRSVDYDKMKPNEIVKLDAFFQNKVYDFEVRYVGREQIKTKVGKMNAIVLSPIMPENGMFSGENAIKMWVSDDEFRVPIKIRADMFIGGVVIEIKEYHNGKTVWK
ncbi:MAG: DUF3108 domain-containing protein [Bernardetiaceae bacterium]|nr:DUF3108 domain-containing protein [Bernardetiaceae bacterium]